MDSSQTKYDHLVGKVIDDRYEILQVKGIGGMAVVLKAKDRLKNRIVAIKMLNEKHEGDSAAVRRFVNESRAIALLSNDHIVDIYDVAFTGKTKYLVMEYIEGITLREYMKRNGPLGLEKSLDFTIQILSALQHAHEKGVVHRDIKPQNIMVQAGDKLKVTDFGIAQISDNNQGNAGVAMGTVYYISPEQASGKTTTFSSDIYSTGVMLYEMATGRLPFEGDTPLSIAMMQVNSAPIRPRKIDPKIPQGLEQIIMRAMNKAPEERFRSAKSMLRACEIIRRDKTVVFEEAGNNKNHTEITTTEPMREPKKVKAPPLTLFPIVMGVFTAFVMVLAVAGVILLSSLIDMTSEDHTITIPIPNLVGQELTDDLRTSLEAQHITLDVTQVNNDVFAAGQIAVQDPQAGQIRKIANDNMNVEIKVQVSVGKSSFTLEDLTNQEYRAALIRLQNLGIVVTVEEQFHGEVIQGHIISYSPAAGTVLKNGETVHMVVSKGAETTYAPMVSVIGETEERAKALLESSGFAAGNITREHADIPEGLVVRQSVAPGEQAAQKYTTVDLVISLGPKDPPPTTTTAPTTTTKPPVTTTKTEGSDS